MSALQSDHRPIRQLWWLAVLPFVAVPALADDRPTPTVDVLLQPYLGVWSGTVTEDGVAETYPMTLCIFDSGGNLDQEVRYRGVYDCDGSGTMIDRRPGELKFSETIIRGRKFCSDGEFSVERSSMRTMSWRWFYAGEPQASASAILSRSEKECPNRPGQPLS